MDKQGSTNNRTNTAQQDKGELWTDKAQQTIGQTRLNKIKEKVTGQCTSCDEPGLVWRLFLVYPRLPPSSYENRTPPRALCDTICTADDEYARNTTVSVARNHKTTFDG